MWREGSIWGSEPAGKEEEKRKGGVDEMEGKRNRSDRRGKERSEMDGRMDGMLLGLSLHLLWLRLCLGSLPNLHGDRNGPITGQTASPAPIGTELPSRKKSIFTNSTFITLALGSINHLLLRCPALTLRNALDLSTACVIPTSGISNVLKGAAWAGIKAYPVSFPL